MRLSAWMTFSRASSRVRPWLTAPGTWWTRATIHPSSSGSSNRIVSRSFRVRPKPELGRGPGNWLADALPVLVELDQGQLVGRGRIGRDGLVEGTLRFFASFEFADQVGAGEEREHRHATHGRQEPGQPTTWGGLEEDRRLRPDRHVPRRAAR